MTTRVLEAEPDQAEDVIAVELHGGWVLIVTEDLAGAVRAGAGVMASTRPSSRARGVRLPRRTASRAVVT